jgi:hypothetical protein
MAVSVSSQVGRGSTALSNRRAHTVRRQSEALIPKELEVPLTLQNDGLSLTGSQESNGPLQLVA